MRRLNVGCGPDIRPASAGWTNMDLARLPGVDVVHDAFSFPWPFPDGHFDEVLCSHILEHVPHDVGIRPRRDGFFVFLEECHRVLRAGGRLEVLTPHPRSDNTIIDPTHTRVVHPESFHYFDPDGGARFHYYTQARFRVVVNEVSGRGIVAKDRLRLGRSRLGLTQHLAMRLPFLDRALRRAPEELHVVLEKA